MKTEPLLILAFIGLVCSGFLLYVARIVLGRPLTIGELFEIMGFVAGPTGIMALLARSLVTPVAKIEAATKAEEKASSGVTG